ncbi:putative GPI-anchored protein 17 [Spathaspora sp. JA1]|nr:putative GPI-anchored protein 17 [Spathaspora sp. JA1]
MRFATILTTIVSFCTFALAQEASIDDLLFELYKRTNVELDERGLLDVASSLYSSFNLSSYYGEIDAAAGWINNLLVNNNDLLVNSLNFVGSTDLVPISLVFVLSNSVTRGIAVDLLADGAALALDTDLTPVFVALKDSNLAYTLVADLIKNKNTLPFLEKVVDDLIASGALDLGNLLSLFTGGGSSSPAATTTEIPSETVTQTASSASSTGGGILSSLVESFFKRDDFPEVLAEFVKRDDFNEIVGEFVKRDDFNEMLEEFMKRDDFNEIVEDIVKRGNISDLLTTILSAVAQSSVINDTLNYLLTSDTFEKLVVQFIQYLLSNIPRILASILSIDFSKVLKVGTELWNSGLLTDIVSKAYKDQSLIAAIQGYFKALFGGGSTSGGASPSGGTSKSSDFEFPSLAKIAAALLGDSADSISSASGQIETDSIYNAPTDIETIAPVATEAAEVTGEVTPVAVPTSLSTALAAASNYTVSAVPGGSNINKLSGSLFAAIAMPMVMFI